MYLLAIFEYIKLYVIISNERYESQSRLCIYPGELYGFEIAELRRRQGAFLELSAADIKKIMFEDGAIGLGPGYRDDAFCCKRQGSLIIEATIKGYWSQVEGLYIVIELDAWWAGKCSCVVRECKIWFRNSGGGVGVTEALVPLDVFVTIGHDLEVASERKVEVRSD